MHISIYKDPFNEDIVSSSRLALLKAPGNSIRYNCQQIRSWLRRPKTILAVRKRTKFLEVINKRKFYNFTNKILLTTERRLIWCYRTISKIWIKLFFFLFALIWISRAMSWNEATWKLAQMRCLFKWGPGDATSPLLVFKVSIMKHIAVQHPDAFLAYCFLKGNIQYLHLHLHLQEIICVSWRDFCFCLIFVWLFQLKLKAST